MTTSLAADLAKDGIALMKGVWGPSDVKTYRRRANELFADQPDASVAGIGDDTISRFLPAFDIRSLHAFIATALGEAPILTAMEVVRSRPGQRQSSLFNREDGVPLKRPRAAVSLNVLLALDPSALLNGAPRIAFSSHRLGEGHPDRPTAPTFDGRTMETIVVETSTTPLLMEPGDMAIIQGTAWRRHGENTSAATRLHLEATYCQKGAIEYFDR